MNGMLELDFAIDRDGLVRPTHATRYKELGSWIRKCYGSPTYSVAAKCEEQGCGVLEIDLTPQVQSINENTANSANRTGVTIDQSMVQEQICRWAACALLHGGARDVSRRYIAPLVGA